MDYRQKVMSILSLSTPWSRLKCSFSLLLLLSLIIIIIVIIVIKVRYAGYGPKCIKRIISILTVKRWKVWDLLCKNIFSSWAFYTVFHYFNYNHLKNKSDKRIAKVPYRVWIYNRWFHNNIRLKNPPLPNRNSCLLLNNKKHPRSLIHYMQEKLFITAVLKAQIFVGT